MKVAVYARISTKDGRQDAENQLSQLRSFADSQGWQITREYIDELSGGTSLRPAFQSMFRDASESKFDLLLFWSLDRLSREGVLETLQHLNRLTGYGVAWRSFTEQFLDSSGMFKDAIVAILSTLAKQEKIRISERTRAGLERARRSGKVLGRPSVVGDAGHIRNMREQGASWNVIARETGHTRSTCQRAVCVRA